MSSTVDKLAADLGLNQSFILREICLGHLLAFGKRPNKLVDEHSRDRWLIARQVSIRDERMRANRLAVRSSQRAFDFDDPFS